MKGNTKEFIDVDFIVKCLNNAFQGKSLSVEEKFRIVLYVYTILSITHRECNRLIQKGSSRGFLEKVLNQQIQYLKENNIQLEKEPIESLLQKVCLLFREWKQRVSILCTYLNPIVVYWNCV